MSDSEQAYAEQVEASLDEHEAIFQAALARGHGVRVRKTGDFTSETVEAADVPAGQVWYERRSPWADTI